MGSGEDGVGGGEGWCLKLPYPFFLLMDVDFCFDLFLVGRWPEVMIKKLGRGLPFPSPWVC